MCNLVTFSRVAIRVQGFHDLTIPDNIPKGPEAMMIRHLACQGYKVLTVSNAMSVFLER